MLEHDQTVHTILFADIANSTRLYDQLGNEKARALITHCLNLLTNCTKAKRGKVIKTIGDEIMSAFVNPDHAVSAAILMQEDVKANETLAAYHIQMRIGLHHGPVILENNDIFGDAVNIAARMVDQAKAGQIITNALTLNLLDIRQQSSARLIDQTIVKGKKEPIDLYELSWGHPEDLTMITTFSGKLTGSKDVSKAALVLETFHNQFTVNKEQPVVTMGRDAVNTIVINDPKVSRLHARIELRKDKFVLVDQSTNGTHLQREDGLTALLRRDELPLPDEGLIGLGEKAEIGSILALKFKRIS